MKHCPLLLFTSVCLAAAAFSIARAKAEPSPASSPRENGDSAPRGAEVDQRGDKGMGFSHNLTGHHFYLSPDGGAIAVTANNPDDAASRDAISTHLTSIAGMFRDGNFSIPMFVHDTMPPGVETMKELRKEISYAAESTPNGGAGDDPHD